MKTTHRLPSDLLPGLLTVTVISLFPALFLYLRNPLEMRLSDAALPAGVSLLVGLALFALGSLITRSCAKSAFFTAIAVLVSENYIYLEKAVRKLIPALRYHQIAILVIAFFVLILYLLRRHGNEELISAFVHVAGPCFLALLLLNGITHFGQITASLKPAEKSEVPRGHIQTTADGNYPAIFLCVIDEYAGFEQIADSFNYDNSAFADRLTEKGFTVSQSSRNESLRTDVVTTNMVNLDYIVTAETADRTTPRINNKLFPLLNQYGIEVIGGAGGDFFGLNAATGNTAHSAATITGETVSDLLLNNSLLYPFFETQPDRIGEETQAWFDDLKSPEKYPKENALIVTYLNAPHIPYVFLADGTLNSRANFYNQSDPKYYVQYHRYVTSQLMEMTDAILADNPNAVIILQSDHGARHLSGDSPAVMRKIFNAVYFQGKPLVELEGLSSVNTLRLILNRLLGTDFEYVEVPEYDDQD